MVERRASPDLDGRPAYFGLLWLMLGGLVLGAWGCVATAATVHTRRARQAVEEAQAAAGGAETQRSYHLTLAQAYLEKAREEASEAQYQDAIRLARASQRHAHQALTGARAAAEAAGKGSSLPNGEEETGSEAGGERPRISASGTRSAE